MKSLGEFFIKNIKKDLQKFDNVEFYAQNAILYCIYKYFLEDKYINKYFNGELLNLLVEKNDGSTKELNAGIDLLITVLKILNNKSKIEFQEIIDMCQLYLTKYRQLSESNKDVKDLFGHMQKLMRVCNNLINKKDFDENIVYFIGNGDKYYTYYETGVNNFYSTFGKKIDLYTYESQISNYPAIQYLHISGHGDGKFFSIGTRARTRLIEIIPFIENTFGKIQIDYMSTLYCNTTKKEVKNIKTQFKTQKVVYTDNTLGLVGGLLYSFGYMYGIISEENNKDDIGNIFTFVFSPIQDEIIHEGFNNYLRGNYPDQFL